MGAPDPVGSVSLMHDGTEYPRANGDNGWETSAEAWTRCVDNGEFNRVRTLDPEMLEICGDVSGKRVLDVGCGEGRFCRMLAERGAVTTGLEPTSALLKLARERQPEGDFVQGVGEHLPFLSDQFDVVVSFLSLIDIPGYAEAIAEMARVCKPGGFLAVANLNSFATASYLYWHRGPNREKLHFAFDDYMIERATWAEWAGIRILNHHRPLSAYMRCFLAAGLVLEHFNEPLPRLSAEELATNTYFAAEKRDYERLPFFWTMRWRKPAR